LTSLSRSSSLCERLVRIRRCKSEVLMYPSTSSRDIPGVSRATRNITSWCCQECRLSPLMSHICSSSDRVDDSNSVGYILHNTTYHQILQIMPPPHQLPIEVNYIPVFCRRRYIGWSSFPGVTVVHIGAPRLQGIDLNNNNTAPDK
jgi:hypothetical protein